MASCRPIGSVILQLLLWKDHDVIRGYLAALLIRLGSRVVEAKNGFEGLQAIKTCRPNIVFWRDGYTVAPFTFTLGLRFV